MKNWIKQIRRKVAGYILGEQVAFFAPAKDIADMEIGNYTQLSDEALAAASRRWFMAIERAHKINSEKEDRPVLVMTSQHAVLSLAKLADEINADNMTVAVRGTIDAYKTTKVFEISLKRLPDDYEFSDNEIIADTDNPDRITKMTISV